MQQIQDKLRNHIKNEKLFDILSTSDELKAIEAEKEEILKNCHNDIKSQYNLHHTITEPRIDIIKRTTKIIKKHLYELKRDIYNTQLDIKNFEINIDTYIQHNINYVGLNNNYSKILTQYNFISKDIQDRMSDIKKWYSYPMLDEYQILLEWDMIFEKNSQILKNNIQFLETITY